MIKIIRRLVWNSRIYIRYYILTKIYGMNIHKEAKVAADAKLDKTNPKGIYIGKETFCAGGSTIFTHDFCRSLKTNTYIGKRCFIGANSIVMAGVTIGDSVIVGSGAVVTKAVPSNCIVAGNPAKIIKEDIQTTRYGRLIK